MFNYLRRIIYDNITLLDPECKYLLSIPEFELKAVPCRYEDVYHSYTSTTMISSTKIESKNPINIYTIKDNNNWYITERNNIPIKNGTKVISVLCSALWFQINDEKYYNGIGFFMLGLKILVPGFSYLIYKNL
jgi:hypothetical protein